MDVGHRALVAHGFGESEHPLERRRGLVQLLPPHPHDRDLKLGAAHCPRSTTRGADLLGRLERRPSIVRAERRLGEHERAKGGCSELGIVELACDVEGCSGMLDGLAEPLPEPEEDPRQDLARTTLHQRLRRPFDDRCLQQLHGGLNVIVVRADAGEDDERAGSINSRGQLRDGLVEQRACPPRIARFEVMVRGRDCALERVRRRVRRGQQTSFLEQFGGFAWRSPCPRQARRFVERRRNACVRPDSGKREVARTLYRVADSCCEQRMNLTTFRRPRGASRLRRRAADG